MFLVDDILAIPNGNAFRHVSGADSERRLQGQRVMSCGGSPAFKFPFADGCFSMEWVLFATEWTGVSSEREAEKVAPQDLEQWKVFRSGFFVPIGSYVKGLNGEGLSMKGRGSQMAAQTRDGKRHLIRAKKPGGLTKNGF
jgi:hypothetical protein